MFAKIIHVFSKTVCHAHILAIFLPTMHIFAKNFQKFQNLQLFSQKIPIVSYSLTFFRFCKNLKVLFSYFFVFFANNFRTTLRECLVQYRHFIYRSLFFIIHNFNKILYLQVPGLKGIWPRSSLLLQRFPPTELFVPHGS
jgi:hypothetical protein